MTRGAKGTGRAGQLRVMREQQADGSAAFEGTHTNKPEAVMGKKRRSPSYEDDPVVSVRTLDPRVADMPENPLNDQEREEFAQLDGIVREHGAAFVAVGEALTRIRSEKLYREQYGTFEEYARKRHELSRPRAYQLIAAATTVRAVEMSTNGRQTPANERQVRPLLKLKAAKKDDPAAEDEAVRKRTEAWQTVVSRANGDRITARLVTKVVKEMLGENGKPERTAAAPPVSGFDPDIVSLDVFSSVSDTVRDWPVGQSLAPLEATLRQLLEIVEKKRAA